MRLKGKKNALDIFKFDVPLTEYVIHPGWVSKHIGLFKIS